MKTELVVSCHTVGESNLHLQFTLAYLYDFFNNPMTRELTVAYLVERAQQLGFLYRQLIADSTTFTYSLKPGQ